MLTQSESNLLPHLLLRSFAGDCLHLLKMRQLVPIEVEDKLTRYKTRIAELVFDPARFSKINAKFRKAGYVVPKKMNVIAVNEDGTILVWGGVNSVFWLRKREPMSEDWEKNLAFQDLGNLTHRFKIKNSKVELDQMMAQLKQTFGRKSAQRQ
jgi:hypothetical protein